MMRCPPNFVLRGLRGSMTTKTSSQAATVVLTDDDVAGYLQTNPDFLDRNAHILGQMKIPGRWSGDGIVDFQKVVTEKMRGEIDHLRAVTNELVLTSRSNQSIQERTHQAVLAVLSARTVGQLAEIVTASLPLVLDLDLAAMCLEPSVAPTPELQNPAIVELHEGDVELLLGDRGDIILTNDESSNRLIFGDTSGVIRSAAIVRLNGGHLAPAGLLALGSRNHSTFHPEQGTELLTFLSRVIEQRIHEWLEPANS
jgi:uncharacterized protein YigA (DUF484 family)